MTDYSSDFCFDIENITPAQATWIEDRNNNEAWWAAMSFDGEDWQSCDIEIGLDRKTVRIGGDTGEDATAEFVRLFLYENKRTDSVMISVSCSASKSTPNSFCGYASLVTAKSITSASPEGILSDPNYKPHVQTFETTIDVMGDICEKLPTDTP